jgi:hypothetical protein
VEDAHGGAGSWVGDYAKDFDLWFSGGGRHSAVNADGDLAASTQFSQGGALCGDGEAGCGVVEEGDGGDSFCVVLAGFNAKRSLTGGGAKVFGVEPIPHPLGFFEAVEAGGGEKDGVNLAFVELAQAGVYIAAELDGFNVGTESFQLGATALAAGSYDGSLGEFSEAPEFYRHEGISRIDSGRCGSQSEGLGEFGGQVFEGVYGEVNAAFGEGFLNLLGEHSLGADLSESDFLEAVAGGFDDFDFDFVAPGAKQGLNVMGLP